MSLKLIKTPLRYPGGKSKASTKMDQYFPDFSKYKEYREPFLGGGSVAIHITKTYPRLKIWVNDLYEPLVNFWQVLQAEDGIRDVSWSRGLGDVYKRQLIDNLHQQRFVQP